MSFKDSFLFITGVLVIIGLLSCDKSPSDSDSGDPHLPASVDFTSPSTSTTYWDDKPITCLTNQQGYQTETTWLIDGEPEACTDGQLIENLPAGEHTVTVRITKEDESIENEVTITVKEGFSVTLDKPENNAEFFVGDQVSCSATITPEKYEEHLQITANGKDCTDGTAQLETAGQTTVRASATISGRTEAEEAIISAKQAIAGKVYPLTDQGVDSQGAGFTVTLEAGGDVIDTGTTSDGSFAIKSDVVSDLGSQQVTLSVSGRSGEFYGSRAVLPADELLALVEADELGFILAPKRWHIRDGKLAGNSADLKLRAAFTRVIPDDPGTSFYRLRRMYVDGEFVYMYLSVPSEYRPFQTAFNRAESEVDITSSDSTSFWRESDDALEPDLGRGNLFTPSSLAQVSTTFDGVHVYAYGAGFRSSAGVTIDKNDSFVFISGGTTYLAMDNFGDWGQTHEQIHHLGFGHASQWDGIMTYEIFDPSGERIRVPGKGMKTPSVDDVAHIQVYLDAMDLRLEKDISFGVFNWMLALDIPGLPPKDGGQKALGKHTSFPLHEKIECDIH